MSRTGRQAYDMELGVGCEIPYHTGILTSWLKVV
jgi:hypothetical protein